MAVAIRMKRMGRKNREYYRICATDRRSPRDGRVIEELGTYDPHVPETDARCTLNGTRVDYWLSVGAQPSDNVRVLIKKYGTSGTHLKAMEHARARLKLPKIVPDPGPPAFVPEVKQPEPVAAPAETPAVAVAEPASEAAAEAVVEAVAVEVPAIEVPAIEVPAIEVTAIEVPAIEVTGVVNVEATGEVPPAIQVEQPAALPAPEDAKPE